MDDSVKAALARWPDVPAVYGWLSLSESGQWRLHPDGTGWGIAADRSPSEVAPGEPIENEQILGFINRNYASDAQGRWFFQNGPQRVYVRLDAAPYILHLDTPSQTFHTHNGLLIAHIREWLIDEAGRLYASTEHGPGMIAGRDAALVFEALHTPAGAPLMEKLEHVIADNATFDIPALLKDDEIADMKVQFLLPGITSHDNADAIAVHFCASSDLGRRLGFSRLPAP